MFWAQNQSLKVRYFYDFIILIICLITDILIVTFKMFYVNQVKELSSDNKKFDKYVKLYESFGYSIVVNEETY